ncbi:MAG: hypothetical protein KatS3mg013_1345 [Actinomycetota bacterium]|nr:MAG: hypothetical protein KatS3mg013_1345 [Actinomycetota bacterium]
MDAERGHRPIEHTADVGIAAWGPDAAAAIEEAAAGLVELVGGCCERVEGVRRVELAGRDLAAAAVGLLNELVYLRDAEGLGFGRVRVRPRPDGLEAEVETGPPRAGAAGLEVKAATLHGLVLEPGEHGAELRVFLDV